VPLPATDAPPVAVHAPAASPLTVDAYAAIASQYVYRGVALRDEATPSVALTTGLPHGVFVDLWSGLVDSEARYDYATGQYASSHGHEWDVDASIGYGAALGDDWQWSVAAARIVDVGDGDHLSHDYDEWRANLFFRDVARAQFAYSPDYKQQNWTSWNVEFAGVRTLTDSMSGEWGIGRSHGAGRPGNDYAYGWLGVTGALRRAQWDVRWSYAQHGGQYVVDRDAAGGRVALTLSWNVHALP
jgi:hypothetical protein